MGSGKANNIVISNEKLKSIAEIVLGNIARFIIYFALVFFVVCLIKDRMYDVGSIFDNFIKYLLEKGFPGSYVTISIVAIFFILYVLLISAVTAVQEQNHFKNANMIRIFVFLMNILPVALFHKVLFYRLGFMVIYYFAVYLIVKLLFELIITNVSNKIIKDDSRKMPKINLIYEFVFMVIAILLINVIIPERYKIFTENKFNPETLFQQVTFFSYIIMFNSISFFTIDYCINIFREEYKKNYTKYYFLYNHSVLKRVIHVLKKALPQIFGKIKSGITWLIMFTITVESIFENTENFSFLSKSHGLKGTLGYDLINTYGASDPYVFVTKIFFVMFAIFVLYLFIDIITEIFKVDKKKNDVKEETNYADNVLPRKSNRVIFICITSIAILFIFLHIYNYKNYAMVGHYEFSSESEIPTLNDLVNGSDSIMLENFNPIYLTEDGKLQQKYANIPLYEKNKLSYSIMQLEIENQGEYRKLIPINDWVNNGYSFIENYMYKGGVENLQRSINAEDKIVKIDAIKKYRLISAGNVMASFRLQKDGKKDKFYEKPYGLTMLYYLQFLMLMIIVTTIYTFFVCRLISKYHFIESENKRLKNILGKLGFAFNELFMFVNAITLAIVLILVNVFLQGGRQVDLIQYADFNKIVFSYVVIQFIINFMFTANYKNDIVLHLKGLLSSNEFEYYNMIGMNNKNQRYIYNKKYGNTLMIKQIFQNILFVFNMNWFTCYAFAAWPGFNDYIGITYAISIENIFSKVIAFKRADIDIHFNLAFIQSPAFCNYLIIILINVALFMGYYYFQNQLINGKTIKGKK